MKRISILCWRALVPALAFCFAVNSASAQAAAATPSPAQAPVLVTKLIGMFNTKSAKVGDAINAKVVKELKLGPLDIPKGSKLVGSVVSVQSKDAGSGTSSLNVKFDHVELKGGQVLKIEGQIVAIGETSSDQGLGYDSVLGRGGPGNDAGIDPSKAGDHSRDDIPQGSSLEGVALGLHLTADGATELRGVKRDIKLDSDTMIKVALFRNAA
jgi:hypothetical protein